MRILELHRGEIVARRHPIIFGDPSERELIIGHALDWILVFYVSDDTRIYRIYSTFTPPFFKWRDSKFILWLPRYIIPVIKVKILNAYGNILLRLSKYKSFKNILLRDPFLVQMMETEPWEYRTVLKEIIDHISDYDDRVARSETGKLGSVVYHQLPPVHTWPPVDAFDEEDDEFENAIDAES